MRLAGYLFSIALMAGSSAASAQIIWDTSHLRDVRGRIDEPLYRSASASLYAKADSLLSVKPLSVMDKQRTAASGDKHDYLSQARYFWPNEETDDGLPYVNRDGVTNPEINKLDRIPLGLTAERVSTLALAYYFSGDEKYAAKAAELLKVWFLNPATRMNPNLEYAQIVPGQNGDKGRCYGVLDGYSFVEMLEGVYLLEGSKAWSVADNRGLQQWFGRLALADV